MTESPLRAIILDFGNVLTMPQDANLVERMERASGLAGEAFRSSYRACRLDYDRGTLDSEAYWQSVRRLGGRPAEDSAELDGELVADLTELDVRSWTVIRQPMIEWVRSLKAAGFKTAILSNMPGDHAAYIERTFDWLDLFDVRLFSYALKLVKPEPEIYEECVRRLGIEPREGLFIDDISVNVAGAQAVGLYGIEFRDEASLAADLAAFPTLPTPQR